MKKDKNAIKLALLWVFSFVVIIFIMSFRVNASDEPAYFPMQQNENNKFPDYLKDYLNTQFDYENNFIFASYSSEEWSYSTKYTYYYVCYFSKQYNDGIPFIYGEINNNGYNFGLYKYPVYPVTSVRVRMSEVTSGGTVSSYSFRINNTYGDNLANFQNFTSSLYSENSSFVSNFRMFVNNQENAEVVLKYGPDPIPPLDIGIAIIPPNAIVPEYPTGSTPPAQVPPTYTPTDYEWTTPPIFDGSTIENAIGSIQNTLGWFANNLKEEFKNITDNGKHFVEYIGKTIQYYGNAIIETLNNAIQNFYDNMKSLVEPIYNKISEFADLFINPFDKDEFEDQINNCALITEYNTLLDNSEVIKQILIDAEEKDSFILYIDFENPFADSEHKIIKSEINFDWLVPLRKSYRPFLWVFTMLECFIGGFRLLGNIIGGKAK